MIILLALAFAVAPTTKVFAIIGEGNTNTESQQTTTLSATIKNACNKAINLSTSSNATVQAHIANMKTDFSNRLTTIDSKQSEVKQKIYTKRADNANKFQAKIDELKAIDGLNDEQLAAIDTYEANMIAANTIRQTAIDQALTDYQTALTEAIKNHQADLITATTTFENSISNAFNKIKLACDSGTDISTLKNSVKEARQKLVTARQSTEYRNEVKQLQETRNAAIKDANNTFKKLASEYKATLLQSLESESSTTD